MADAAAIVDIFQAGANRAAAVVGHETSRGEEGAAGVEACHGIDQLPGGDCGLLGEGIANRDPRRVGFDELQVSRVDRPNVKLRAIRAAGGG